MTDLQVRLSRAIRQSLSTRGVLDGERSTDLLLGLLVYLAWHHQRFGHAQAYRYICLLAGIAADEGIYRRRSPPENTEDLAFIVERDRAFVGCYYLCASLSSTGFHRPSPLRWTDNLRQCGENVARFGSLLSDRSLISIVELLHATEVFEKSSQAPAHLTQSVDHFRELNAKAAQHRLETLRAEHPSLASNRAFTAAAIRIYQRLLGTTNLPATSTLIRCACTIKEYIDDVLNRPPNTLHQLAIVDWTDLLDILMLMARISTPLPSAEGWEAGALTSMLPPEDVLNSVCAHMASAPADDPLAPRNEDLIRWLRRFCESVKSRIVRDRQDQSRPLNGSAIATSGEVPPLPYGAEVKDGPVISMPDAVLDEAFLNNFMRLP